MSRIYDDQHPGGGPAPPGQRRKRIPGQTWDQLIKSDSRYTGYKANLAGLSAADAAKRQAAVRAALISLGGVPNLRALLAGVGPKPAKPGMTNAPSGDNPYSQWLGQDVDQATLDAAQNNQYSFFNQENRAHEANLTNMKDVLASQGILSSGQTGFETGQENYRHSGSINDAVQNLLGLLSGQYGDFASAEAGRASDLGAYGDTIKGDLLAEGANPAGSPGEAVWDPGANAYVLNGKHYNEQGQLIPSLNIHANAPVNPGITPMYQAPHSYGASPGFPKARKLIRKRYRRYG